MVSGPQKNSFGPASEPVVRKADTGSTTRTYVLFSAWRVHRFKILNGIQGHSSDVGQVDIEPSGGV